ncbi:MAG: hypothetical protein IPK03_05940 [Bacteroidetes bacterium]|nr:hypothetical protein [Bacteroidota bacterium]
MTKDFLNSIQSYYFCLNDMRLLVLLFFFATSSYAQQSLESDSALIPLEIDSIDHRLLLDRVELNYKELKLLYKDHPIALQLIKKGHKFKVMSTFSHAFGAVVLCLPIIPLAYNYALNPLLVLGNIAVGTVGIYYGIEWTKKRNARWIESGNRYNQSIGESTSESSLQLRFKMNEVGMAWVF